MDPQELKLTPGSGIQLQFHNRGSERLISRIIGYLPGASILVSTPKSDEKIILLRKNQTLTVRFFHNTTACAFETQILHSCSQPFPYLHLAYPETIASDEVRKARRVSTKLETNLSSKTESRGRQLGRGMISDFSTTGAKVLSRKDIADVGDVIDITTTLQIAHISKILNIKATVRGKNPASEQNFSYIYGLEFSNLLEEDYILINSFVYTEIVENSG